MFTIDEFGVVTQPRLRGIEAISALQDKNSHVPQKKRKYNWSISDVIGETGHWALKLERQKRRGKESVPDDSATSGTSNGNDAKVETLVFVMDNVPPDHRLNQEQHDWLCALFQNDQKSPILPPNKQQQGLLLSRHPMPLTSLFFSSSGREEELFLFATEPVGILYVWQWTRWRWKFLNRVSLNRGNPGTIVRNAAFLPKQNILVWHSSSVPATRDGEGAADVGKPRSDEDTGSAETIDGSGILMTCTLNVERREVDGKTQTQMRVGYTTTLGSISPEVMLCGRTGLWLRNKTQLLLWSTRKGAILRQPLPGQPLLNVIHGLNNKFVCLFDGGRLVAYEDDASSTEASIVETALPTLSPCPKSSNPSGIVFAFDCVVVLDGEECLFYDANTGVMISSVSVLEDVARKGLWSIGGAGSACGLWSADNIWLVGFQFPPSYAAKLDPSKVSLAQRLHSGKTTAAKFGPSSAGTASKFALELASELENQGGGGITVWKDLDQRLQNPILALASQGMGESTVLSKELIEDFLKKYNGEDSAENGENSLQYFTPLNAMMIPHMKRILKTMELDREDETPDDEPKLSILRPEELYDRVIFEENENDAREVLEYLEETMGIQFDDDGEISVFGQGPHFQLLLVPEHFPGDGKRNRSPPLYELMSRLYFRFRCDKLEEFVLRVTKRAGVAPSFKADRVKGVYPPETAYFHRAMESLPPTFAGEETDVQCKAKASLMYWAGDHVGAIYRLLKSMTMKKAIAFVKGMVFSKLGPPAIGNATLIQKQVFEELLLYQLRLDNEKADDCEQMYEEIFELMPEVYRITQLLVVLEAVEEGEGEDVPGIKLNDVLKDKMSLLFGRFVSTPLVWGEN
jgi:hypothetical protein|eukprot:g6809.t1